MDWALLGTDPKRASNRTNRLEALVGKRVSLVWFGADSILPILPLVVTLGSLFLTNEEAGVFIHIMVGASDVQESKSLHDAVR
jgi:hypothetical protein